MRILLTFMCVLALGLMGCSETAGTGGTAGDGGGAGIGGGGVGGDGGAGGDGGTVAQCVDNVCRCTESGIRAAITLGGAEPYTFDCGDGKTVVTQRQIVINNDVTLDGGGMLTIDGNDTHRVFSVPSGITAELRGITVTGGVAQPPIPSHVPPHEFERGGGIYSEGTLTLDNCAVWRNHAEDFGGGISFSSLEGGLTLTNTIVSENTAGNGGGISGGGTLVMTDSKVLDNRAAGSYGGVGLSGRITMMRSAVSENTAGTYVGGISQRWPEGSLTIVDSTVSGNTAGEGAGGISANGALTLTNSTVSHNTSLLGRGGGIATSFLDLLLTNSTVSNNTALYGGGIHLVFGVLRLASSTISGNIATGTGVLGSDAIWIQEAVLESRATLIDGACLVLDSTLISHGYNIESPGNTCGFDRAIDLVNVPDPMLGPLQDNGGPTETHALLPGSPAINRIPWFDCEVETDQRGEPRPGGTMCDVGAFERQPDDPEP